MLQTLCQEIRYRQIFQALVIGFLFAAVFLTLAFLVQGAPLKGGYFRILVWAGVYGFPIGFLVFAPSFRLIPGHSLFWRYSIGALFGGSVAFGILYFLLPELAMTFVFGAVAIIMGFFTFLTGSILHYRELTRDAREDTGRPQQDGNGNPKQVAS